MRKVKYSKTDFKYSSLPTTRKALFFDLFRNQYKVILKCGFVLLMFSLPFMVFSIVMDFVKLGIYQNVNEEELSGVLMLWSLTFNIGFIVLMFVLLIAISGLMRVIRQLVWSEGVDFWYDFKIGVKQNYPHFALSTGIILTFYLISYLMLIFFGFSLLGLSPMVLFIVFFIGIYIWYILLANLYDSNFKEFTKNGLFFYIKTLGWSILFMIALALPLMLNLIGNINFISLKYLIFVIVMIFYYPVIFTIMELYSLDKFDKYINIENYKDYYRKGLF